MEPEIILGLLLRLLPAIVVVVLGFVAVSDKKTRDQWNNLLYQVGSIRPDQKEDAKIGSGVKWPFFLVALFLLIWPTQYYRHATRSIDASASDLKMAKPKSDLSQTTPVTATKPAQAVAPQSDLHQTPASPNTTTAPQSDLHQTPASPNTTTAPQSDLHQTPASPNTTTAPQSDLSQAAQPR